MNRYTIHELKTYSDPFDEVVRGTKSGTEAQL